jgi:hypothetical protein
MNVRWAGVFVVGIIVCLFFIRLVLPSQLDDVNPLMNCSEEVLDLGDVYFVIPKFSGIAIDGEWCEEILNKNKELGMHGIYHTYNEFGIYRDGVYFNDGVEIFRDCFGFGPERFKPGHLVFSEENYWIRNMVEVDLIWNQIFHKVYHCGDSGVFPNWMIRIF